MKLTPLTDAHLDAAAEIWTLGWADGHTGLVPDELVARRTRTSFRERLWAHKDDTTLALLEGKPAGFYILEEDQLYQFYVAAEARGSGLAGSLIQAAEKDLAAGGHTKAWLACTVGNNRAARFYEKSGWINTRTEAFDAYTEQGPITMDVWRFEKSLRL